MTKCPLNLNQLIFQLHRTTGTKMSTPSIIGWTVANITDDYLGNWSTIITHQFDGETNPQTRTVIPNLWNEVYHLNAASAVKKELEINRKLVGDLYKYIDSLKGYLYSVEGLGIIINNNNKQGNPLDINIF